jgi:hypothetical protein
VPHYLEDDEYEDCYREAVLILEERFGSRATIESDTGKRQCIMCNFAFDDFYVFVLAWGLETAGTIEAQRTAYLTSNSN